MNVKKLTFLSISVALAMILSFVESQIPPLAAVPGVKIGLSNIVTVFLLYKCGWREAAAVSLVRVGLSALIFGNFASFLYSLSGAILSFAVMIVLKNLPVFSIVGVSVAGGVFHNAGQIICAVLLMENGKVAFYLPPLIIFGTLAGAFIGIASGLLVKKLKSVSL